MHEGIFNFNFYILGEEGIHSPPSSNGDGGEVKVCTLTGVTGSYPAVD